MPTPQPPAVQLPAPASCNGANATIVACTDMGVRQHYDAVRKASLLSAESSCGTPASLPIAVVRSEPPTPLPDSAGTSPCPSPALPPQQVSPVAATPVPALAAAAAGAAAAAAAACGAACPPQPPPGAGNAPAGGAAAAPQLPPPAGRQVQQEPHSEPPHAGGEQAAPAVDTPPGENLALSGTASPRSDGAAPSGAEGSGAGGSARPESGKGAARPESASDVDAADEAAVGVQGVVRHLRSSVAAAAAAGADPAAAGPPDHAPPDHAPLPGEASALANGTGPTASFAGDIAAALRPQRRRRRVMCEVCLEYALTSELRYEGGGQWVHRGKCGDHFTSHFRRSDTRPMRELSLELEEVSHELHVFMTTRHGDREYSVRSLQDERAFALLQIHRRLRAAWSGLRRTLPAACADSAARCSLQQLPRQLVLLVFDYAVRIQPHERAARMKPQ
eukprot:TRINITY_DN9030_c0_g2_i1.p1 TRINITY_DN9030_c0_g2~~TRINITY_DN9030_c0_g2_i1.p1  ORF type:complete len:484 (+),score=80.71 TRINITY_DN9030_c0_g2_i1:109-1452(+)